MIPKGAHFIHTTTKDGQRMGFFVWIEPKSVLVFEWDNKLSCLIPYKDEDQKKRLIIGVRNYDFDKNLGAYPFKNYKIWNELSNFITDQLLMQLSSKSGIISSTFTQIKKATKNAGMQCCFMCL